MAHRIGNAEKMVPLVLGVNPNGWPANAEMARLMDIQFAARSDKPREEKIEDIIDSLRGLELTYPGYCSEGIKLDCSLYGSEQCPYLEKVQEYRKWVGEDADLEGANIVECEIADGIVRKAAVALLEKVEPKGIFSFLFR